MRGPSSGAPRSLAIAAVTLAVQNGIVMAFGVLYLPLITEFALPRAEVAGVQSALLLLSGVTGPLVGWGLDRLGPRRFFPACALVAAAALVAASRSQSLSALMLSYGVLGGLGLSGLGSQANMTVAALWYPRARGRAIALVDLGTGFGAFAFIPLAQLLLGWVGWRGVLLVWAALLALLIVPVNLLQRVPEQGGGRGEAAGAEAPAPVTLSGALRTRAFWTLALVRHFSAMGFPLVNVHMVAFAISAGVPPVQAAAALGSVSLMSLGGRMTTGWLADRIGRAPTLTITYASAILGLVSLSLLAWHGSHGWLVAYVLFYGFAQGSSGIIASARTADLFAGPHFGTIYGWMSLAVGPGEAIGAWAGGAIYDATGSYLWGFAFVAAVLAAAVGLIWQVRAPYARGST
ncbi:MAG TPA: MFS transporter [Methylomirabilota bacterium]|nr:MFS transporter [Methylomirabilota bacterium]